MSPEQIDLVEASVVALGDLLDGLVREFYDRLFHADPTIRPLFGDDLATQRAKFAAELAFIVTTIRRHDRFMIVAGALGVRHDEIGVRPEHVRTAGAALLEAFAATLGAAWTTELAEAWRRAYNLTAEAMAAGAVRNPRR